jgi:hypothetical protein
MRIGAKLLKVISKKYPPASLIPARFERYDLAMKTDDEGNVVVLFIGNANDQGIIKGDRFTRVLVKDESGKLLKDHWDYKGKV